jgi:NADH-quinone oxidoreductase subunit M
MKFLVFTQLSSLTLLAVFILFFSYTGSFNLGVIQQLSALIPIGIQYVILSLLLVTVLIKMPLFPLHAWLPDAYTSAPTSGTILLSSLLSKMGGFALIIFGFEMIPSAMSGAQPFLIAIGLLTVIYISIVATAQRDLKRLFSYSSMIYMALIFIGISSLTTFGVDGAVLLIVSHSFIIALLFILSAELYDRTGTYDMSKMGGLALRMPVLSFFFVFSVLAVMGVPGLSNFVGELLVFLGAYSVLPISLIGLIGVIISTNYYLKAIKSTLFGQIRATFSKLGDVSRLDTLQLLLLSAFVVLVGVLPGLILSLVGATL